jgi:hypothetical protein
MVALAGFGVAAGFAYGGWKWGLGFLLGALVSAAQFWLLKLVVNGLAGGSTHRRGLRATLRLAALAGVAYVIFRVSPVSLTAALAGIFVLTAAVFVEVAIEIAYARK